MLSSGERGAPWAVPWALLPWALLAWAVPWGVPWDLLAWALPGLGPGLFPLLCPNPL